MGNRTIKEKRERSLDAKLFLKPDRCDSHKCVMVRRPYRPGQHGKKRRRVSEFGRQLQEKQKIRFMYGLTDGKLRKIFKEHAGDPKEVVKTLEKRLDRVVYHLRFARSHRIGRQLVSHGHIMVNGRKVTIPSYQVEQEDVVTIRPQSRDIGEFQDLGIRLKNHEPPEWLELDKEEEEGVCGGNPSVEAILPFDINMVGEYYNQ